MPPACCFIVNSLHIPTNQFTFSTEKPHQNVGRYIALNQITPYKQPLFPQQTISKSKDEL